MKTDEPFTREMVLEYLSKRGSRLESMNMKGADLSGMDLSGARFLRCNMGDCNLENTYLRGASFDGCSLWNANFAGAKLSITRFYGVSLEGLLQVSGLPSGIVTLIPTYRGWVIQVGCWSGTLQELQELIRQNHGWPEAEGDEVRNRRPALRGLLKLAQGHIAHPGYAELPTQLAELWQKTEQ